MKKLIAIIMLGVFILVTACSGQASQSIEQPVPQEQVVEEPEDMLLEPEPGEGQAVQQSSGESAMMDYSAPEDLFKLRIPSTWNLEKDTQSIENTVLETFTAPDGNAFVQVMANKVNYSLNNVLKGQVTLDYMKRLYGADMRVATDAAMPDGRERLEWWSEENKTSGTTYFDMGNRYLFFYTVGYKNANESDYAAILKDVAESYTQ